ncbi:MAG: tyrosine protein phosphatase [Isosphaera sp.]|nr:tyrosine protein phosphatase [Isosphaera sp.]
MRTELFWVPVPFPGRLAVAPRPRGGDWLADEMGGWRAAGVETVVSLLEADEAAGLDLAGEEAAARAHGVRFRAFPVPDRGVPAARTGFRELVAEVTAELAAGRRVAVHCRQGVGRAGLVAAGVLIAAGLDPAAAAARVGAARGRPVPETDAQRHWLDEFAGEGVTAR